MLLKINHIVKVWKHERFSIHNPFNTKKDISQQKQIPSVINIYGLIHSSYVCPLRAC